MASIPSVLNASFDPGPKPTSEQRAQQSRGEAARSERAQREREATESEKPAPPPTSSESALPAPPNRAVTFRLNSESERVYIEVVDRSTGEVVRQIPPDQVLELAEGLKEATGNLLDVST